MLDSLSSTTSSPSLIRPEPIAIVKSLDPSRPDQYNMKRYREETDMILDSKLSKKEIIGLDGAIGGEVARRGGVMA